MIRMAVDNIKATDEMLFPLSRVNDKLRHLKFFYTVSKNWYDPIFFSLKIKPTFVLELKNGDEVLINNQRDYNRIEIVKAGFDIDMARRPERQIRISSNRVSMKFNGRSVSFYYDSEQKLRNLIVFTTENFIEEQFNKLNVNDRDVLDIGANVGDTAIYFALKGAKKVYALEPFKYLYNQAVNNVKINKLGQRITLINACCGPKNTNIHISKSNPGDAIKKSSKGYSIRMMTLGKLSEMYKLKNAVLKMDCEGWEYKIFLSSSNETLRRFSEIMLEYHYGYLNLKKKLNDAGFKVSHTRPHRFVPTVPGMGYAYTGMVYARRIDEDK